jgi:hypothetical protein
MKEQRQRAWMTAGVLAGAMCLAGPQLSAQGNNTSKPETPRTADGKPDLTGRWGGGGGGGGGVPTSGFDADGNYETVTIRRGNSPVNSERDPGMTFRYISNLPLYKPEHWDRVDYLDNYGNKEDPAFHCFPDGVPRMGAPDMIIQQPNQVIFLYGNGNKFRVIPTDGRPHHPIWSKDQTLMGDPVGRWEGDTLVIDVVGFSEDSWLGWPGYFHSAEMRVIERLRREGNTLIYQATVEDPVLMEPWVMDEERLNLNTNPNAYFVETPHCIESDGANMYTRERG